MARPSVPTDWQAGYTCGQGFSPATQQAFNEGLAALATLHPDIAANIQVGLDSAQFVAGELISPNTLDGASDSDTMLINFKTNSSAVEIAFIILHEWAHVTSPYNGNLYACQHAFAYYETWATACGLNCEFPPGAGARQMKMLEDAYKKFGLECIQSGDGSNLPTSAPNCPCNF